MMQQPTAAPDQSSTPVLTIDGARATIRLNRPKHLNRMQPEDLEAMAKLFDRVEADDAIRVLVLTGTGRAFSAGYDLNSVADRAATTGEQTAGSAFEVMVDRLEDLGGADHLPAQRRRLWRLDRSCARLRLSHRRRYDRDVHAGGAARPALLPSSGIRRYVSRLGADNARKLFLTAQKIDAPEMLRIGYLTAMVPPEALDEEVDRLAAVLAGNAPIAMRGMKRTINEDRPRCKLDKAAADQRARDGMRGAEIKEGVRAFAEKRPPKFRLRSARPFRAHGNPHGRSAV